MRIKKTLNKDARQMNCVGGVPAGEEVGIVCGGGYSNVLNAEVQFLPLSPAAAPCRVLGSLYYAGVSIIPLWNGGTKMTYCE